MTIPEIIISITVIIAGLFSLGTALALWRAPDPLTRANLVGPTVGVVIPLLIMCLMLREWTTTGFANILHHTADTYGAIELLPKVYVQFGVFQIF